MPVGRLYPVAVTVARLGFLPNEDSEKSDYKLLTFLPFYSLISVFPNFPSFPFLPRLKYNNQVRLSSLNEQIQIKGSLKVQMLTKQCLYSYLRNVCMIYTEGKSLAIICRVSHRRSLKHYIFLIGRFANMSVV